MKVKHENEVMYVDEIMFGKKRRDRKKEEEREERHTKKKKNTKNSGLWSHQPIQQTYIFFNFSFLFLYLVIE
jgi:hypothetical protein